MNRKCILAPRWSIVVIASALFISSGVLATEHPPGITGIDINPQGDVIQLTTQGNIQYGYFPLSDPDRLVFDFPGTSILLGDENTVDRQISDSVVSEIKLAEFSTEPLITRLVVYLRSQATATVDYSSNDAIFTIFIGTNGTSPEIVPAATNSRTDLLSQEPTVDTQPVESVDVYAVQTTEPAGFTINSTENESRIVVNGVEPDDIDTEILKFPDRLHVRLFSSGRSDVRPRFDPSDRGNIWNAVAKQWASYTDRDNLGITDITIYLYSNVTFTQSINAQGTPEITLRRLTPQEIAQQPATQCEIEVSAFNEDTPVETPDETSEPTSGLDPSSLFQAPISIDPYENGVPLNSTGVNISLDDRDRVIVINPIETVDVIENGSFLASAPVVQEERTDVPDVIDAADKPADGVPVIPMQITPYEAQEIITNLDSSALTMRVGDVVAIEVQRLVRASVGNPLVATLNVISQSELLVTALTAGTTTIVTWESDGGRKTRTLYVYASTEMLESQIAGIINNPNIMASVIMSGTTTGIVLEGSVETEEEMLRAGSIATLFVGDTMVSNLIEVTNPRQVMVKVRVVEIDKRALDDQLSYFSAAARTDTDDFTIGIITNLLDPANPGGGLVDTSTRPGIVNGDAQDMVFDPIDAMLSALETNREANILSEPNVISLSGHLAHFRVGGEVPYTYQNENGFNVVEFKEFGIQVDMTPYVDSQNNIRLEITPSVRTIDKALAIAGIPGFRTREMNTQVQLRPGESLVIGGLIQHEITEIVSAVPFLSEIPILGELFRSRSFNDDETELVIFLTPYIIENPSQAEAIVGIDENGVEE